MLGTLGGAIHALQQVVDQVNEVRISSVTLTPALLLVTHVSQCNRNSEDIATLISWSKRLEYDAIVSPDRKFVCEGSAALVIDGMKTDVLLFLFSDQVLYSRKLGLIGRLKEKYKVVRSP